MEEDKSRSEDKQVATIKPQRAAITIKEAVSGELVP